MRGNALPPEWHNSIVYKDGKVELYSHRRFFAVTGLVFEGRDTITECQGGIERLYAIVAKDKKPRVTSPRGATHNVGYVTPPEHEDAISRILMPMERRAQQCANYIEAFSGSREGRNAGTQALHACRACLYKFALDYRTALDVLLTHWAEKEDQVDASGQHWPWTELQLRHKLDSALAYGPVKKIGDGLRLFDNNDHLYRVLDERFFDDRSDDE
jgi:hypothetical protein